MDEDQVIEWEDAIPSGDGTNLDDYGKLFFNTLTGGAYDFGEFLYAGNPVNYLTGYDFPGIGEVIFGKDSYPGEDGTFFDYDMNASTFGMDPNDLEEITKGVMQFLIPIGGIPLAAMKAPKALNMISQVFPSLKYFNELAKGNKYSTAYRNALKLVEKAKGKGKATANDVALMVQSGLANAGKFKRFLNSFIKPYAQTFYRPFNPKNYFGKNQKLKPNTIVNKKSYNPFKDTKPELNYAKNAIRNYAVASTIPIAKKGIEYLADRNPEKFDRFIEQFDMSAGAAEPPSYSNYVDPIMKMAKPNRPAIGIQFSDGPTYWG